MGQTQQVAAGWTWNWCGAGWGGGTFGFPKPEEVTVGGQQLRTLQSRGLGAALPHLSARLGPWQPRRSRTCSQRQVIGESRQKREISSELFLSLQRASHQNRDHSRSLVSSVAMQADGHTTGPVGMRHGRNNPSAPRPSAVALIPEYMPHKQVLCMARRSGFAYLIGPS